MDKPTQGMYQSVGSLIVKLGDKAICQILDGTTTDAPKLNIHSPNWESMLGESQLIVAAVNACKAVNPSNPLAVANQIEAAFNALRDYQKANPLHNDAEAVLFDRADKVLSSIAKKEA